MNARVKIAIAVIVPLVIVSALSVRTFRISQRLNGFNRKFFRQQPILVQKIPTQEALIDIAGGTADEIFFTTALPGQIISLKSNGTLYQKQIKIAGLKKPYKIILDSPDIFIASGNKRTVYHTRWTDDSGTYNFVPGGLYSRLVRLQSGSFIFRQFMSKSRDEIFIKRTPDTFDSLKGLSIRPLLSEGGVLTDGMLDYIPGSSYFIYVYYHKGAYLRIDTNMSAMVTGKTVDTFRSFHEIEFYRSRTHGQPGPEDFVSINLASCISGNYLLIYSTVRADNEKANEFKANFDIDIYDLNTLSYAGTFRLPRMGQEKIQAMKSYNGKLATIYRHFVAIYSLPEVKD